MAGASIRMTGKWLVLGAIGVLAVGFGLMAGARFFDARTADEPSTVTTSRSQTFEFYSPALGRTMPLIVFVPPGYESSSERLPVLYVLHGLGGHQDEWEAYGLFDRAAELIEKGEIPPVIIVLPEGEDGYWFNHANGGPRWGDYLAHDVVAAVDSRYRTLASRDFRAVGGLSMGADGAMQIALNNPDVFGIVQAHGPVLRPFEQASPAYGDIGHFEANNPVTLMRDKADVARSLKITLDVGDADLWFETASAFHEQLVALEIPHEWFIWPGGHDYNYWIGNIPNNLYLLGRTLRSNLTQAPQ